MELLQIQSIQLNNYKNTFKESSRYHLLVTIVALLLLPLPGLARFLSSDKSNAPLWGIIVSTGFLVLFVVIAFKAFVKTLSPFNWLLAIGNDSILINFRSYLNTNYPKYDKHVAAIPFSEISAIRMNDGEIKYPNPKSIPTQEKIVCLDIITAIEDLQELKDQLRYERNILKGKGGYVPPVTLVDDKIIRIIWKNKGSSIAPNISYAINILSQHVDRGADINQKEDFTSAEVLQRKDLEDKILQLCQQGNAIVAVKIAMKAYNLNTTQAKEFIDKLMK